MTVNKGNFDRYENYSVMSPFFKLVDKNVQDSYKLISHGKPKLVIYTDSSMVGWGGAIVRLMVGKLEENGQ